MRQAEEREIRMNYFSKTLLNSKRGMRGEDIAINRANTQAIVLDRNLGYGARFVSRRFSEEDRVGEEWKQIGEIPLLPRHDDLVQLTRKSIAETGFPIHSRALHDASVATRAGIPSALVFVQSLRGLSHTKEEDTKEEHFKLSVLAFDLRVTKSISWMLSR